MKQSKERKNVQKSEKSVKRVEKINMLQILIVEDDRALGEGVSLSLKNSETEVECCNSLAEARQRLKEASYQLFLIDINLPDGNGLDLLREIKEEGDTPVILLTANDMEIDIVNGLEHGADDYITKPFSLAILRARVNTQIRRGSIAEKTTFSLDEYTFDFAKMLFAIHGKSVDLSKSEQKLLRLLVENRGSTVSREVLVDRIWTDGADYVDENALSVTVKRLRDKLDAHDRIKTVYGIGYTWK